MPKATTIKHTFSRETSVSININSSPDVIWDILVDGQNYPKWNTTVLALDGQIQLGQKVRLTSHLDPKRVFTLKITEFTPNQSLAWGDAMGKRTFTLTKLADGTTDFSMTERIGGLLFPLFASMIPPFDESFEKFAADLKAAAEKK